MKGTSDPPPAVPGDQKDWTWVLERVCEECRFDVREFAKEEVGSLLRSVASEWLTVLEQPPPRLAQRPEPEVWSPLEYAAHVRDVFAIYSHRLQLMMAEDGSHYPNWDQDVTAVEQRYDLSDPAEVAGALRENAARLADQFDAVTGPDWERTGFRSDGAAFTIETFARYFLHDPIHHLHDVGVRFMSPDRERRAPHSD